jgi:hypothetical protein
VLAPLKLAGESNETALADAVLTDISHQASDLPLLQVALRAAWQEHKSAGRPMIEAYQTVGRVSGALAREADKARAKLPKEDLDRLDSIFVRLVRLGDTGGATRGWKSSIHPAVTSCGRNLATTNTDGLSRLARRMWSSRMRRSSRNGRGFRTC